MKALSAIILNETRLLFRTTISKCLFLIMLIILYYNYINSIYFWTSSGIPSFVPYRFFIFFTILKSYAAIYLATDFWIKEKRIHAIFPIYARSMNNSTYVIGKVLGMLVYFSILDLIAITVSIIADSVLQLGVSPLYYIYYTLLFGLPSMLFIIGSAFV